MLQCCGGVAAVAPCRGGARVTEPNGGGVVQVSYQFMTVAGDGQILVWDTHFTERRGHRRGSTGGGKVRRRRRPARAHARFLCMCVCVCVCVCVCFRVRVCACPSVFVGGRAYFSSPRAHTVAGGGCEVDADVQVPAEPARWAGTCCGGTAVTIGMWCNACRSCDSCACG